jgi:hypothetical protein
MSNRCDSYAALCIHFKTSTAGALLISISVSFTLPYARILYSLAFPVRSHDNSCVVGAPCHSSFIGDLIYEL